MLFSILFWIFLLLFLQAGARGCCGRLQDPLEHATIFSAPSHGGEYLLPEWHIFFYLCITIERNIMEFGSFPKNLAYIVKSLSGFSKTVVKLVLSFLFRARLPGIEERMSPGSLFPGRVVKPRQGLASVTEQSWRETSDVHVQCTHFDGTEERLTMSLCPCTCTVHSLWLSVTLTLCLACSIRP